MSGPVDHPDVIERRPRGPLARLLCLMLCWLQLMPPAWAVVDIAQMPLDGMSFVKPNILFAVDDSGSMDFEVMLNTNDGAFWWDSVRGTGWDASGKPLFNLNGLSGSDGTSTWVKYNNLFANGCVSSISPSTPASINNCDRSGPWVIPPTPQFASLRSPTYNPSYYDTRQTYLPWASAYVNGSTRSFFNATPTSALSHPALASSGSSDLTALHNGASVGLTFRLAPGMVLPGATMSGIRTAGAPSGPWSAPLTTDLTITAANLSTNGFAAIQYRLAHFWNLEACSPDGSSCVQAPDGATLKRYDITGSNTYPSGRSTAAELQNFANWYQYYRKRKLMMAGAMGHVLSGVTNVRGGYVGFNWPYPKPASVTMLDFDAASDSANAKAIIGQLYTLNSVGSTPTRSTLNYVGQQFEDNTSIVQYACQRNAAFVLTDGYADNAPATPRTYDPTRWGTPAPYGAPYPSTLADIALGYYTRRIRTDLPSGKVPIDSTSTRPGTDRNTDLHMNTYAITLGARGTLWPSSTDPFTQPPTWPDPNANRSPTAIDDLWLATLNGRGQFLLATDINALTQSVQDILNDIVFQSGSASAIGLRSPSVRTGSNIVYWSSYSGRGWTGDLNAGTIDTTTGAISSTSAWSAAALLESTAWNTRKIASFNGSAGVPFTESAIGAQIGMSPGGTTAQLVNWLRGDRSLEGSTYRKRVSLLGDVVNAEPVESPDGSVVFQAANDGMLHAFNATTGREMWAYVPSGVLPTLGALATRLYSHRFYVDGTPTVQELDNRQLVLVGGLRAGGKGYYALDVTDPTATSDTDVASKVLWEFPNAASSTTMRANIGLSYSRPAVVKTLTHGWVVLVSSGYNPSGDGKGRVFMLNARTGAVIREFVTSATADIGQVSTFVSTSAAGQLADAAYAGDLAGNLWHFDLATGATRLIATLTDGSGAAQPITTAPELTMVENQRVVLVGTGKLLGISDFSPTQIQSFYAITDTGTTVANIRTDLDARSLSIVGGTRTLTGTAPNWRTRRGWYVDLPAGELAHTDPVIAQGSVFFTTNQPSGSACESKSYLYMIDIVTGAQRSAEVFGAAGAVAWAGSLIGNVMASRVTVARLPSMSLVALVHQSDNTVATRTVMPGRSQNIRRAAWKEVQR